ncbi:hypothetical protein AHiyo8_41140 [Arthrobacter sp. Hiyo8]|nr:hypothetical protein AHiyo8_41140 [Arthrobacter sp. Hiyo8]
MPGPNGLECRAIPINRLPTAARPTAMVMDVLRPIRSPIQPKTKPPNGRATNPTAKIAKVERTADVGSALLKSALAMKGENVA